MKWGLSMSEGFQVSNNDEDHHDAISLAVQRGSTTTMTTTTTTWVAWRESFSGVSSLNKAEWVSRKSRDSHFLGLLYDAVSDFHKLVDWEWTRESTQIRPSLRKIGRVYFDFDSTSDLTRQSLIES